MNNSGPLLSVIIPAFNADPYIQDCLNSVFEQQDCPPFEVIVIDDGSTDRTGELVRQMSVIEPRLHLISSVNRGPGSARNIGVEAAVGEIIIFLDADDKMLPGRLQHQGGYMLAHPEASATFGDMIIQNSSTSPIDVWGLPEFAVDEYQEIQKPLNRFLVDGCYVCNSASAVRRENYITIGKQNISLRVAEDLDFWCRLSGSGKRFFVTHKKYTWLRREGHGNLMASRHTYKGPTLVLAQQLRLHGHKLSPRERDKAQRLLDERANMYLRHLWAYDRTSLKDVSTELADIVGAHVINRWHFARFMPASMARGLRWLKHGGAR